MCQFLLSVCNIKCHKIPSYLSSINRSFVTSAAVSGRKSRDPYDRRFGVHPKDAAPNRPGGTRELAEKINRASGDAPHPPGIFDRKGRFIFVKELVPEFVVPDLKGFTLKAYVSYRVPDITQSEFTARDLFDATYAKSIVEDFKDGKLDANGVKVRIDRIKSSSVKK